MKLGKLLAGCGMFLIVFGLLITVIDGMCFWRSFYVYEYQKGNTAETIGMSDDDLMKTTDVLLAYLRDQRDDLVTTAVVNGSQREVFDQRETLHMKDVKALYQKAMIIRTVSMAAGAVCLFLAWLGDRRQFLRNTEKGFHAATLTAICFVGGIALWACADFDQFWLNFHYLFFDNDLFLLDPNTEILINMVPGTFFFDLVLGIIFIYAAILLLIHAILRLAERKLKTC